MRILILADVHANLSAFQAVISSAMQYRPDSAVFLGDLIDYGMRPNEVIAQMERLPFPVLCALRGNHEHALLNQDMSRFSSARGIAMSQYTQSQLSTHSRNYISNLDTRGYAEIGVDGKRILLVHGDMNDPFWGKLAPDGAGEMYQPYDVVLSGHTHRPHYFERYHPAPDSPYRGEKKTIFINPGSVGQPRNHNPLAQYAIFDTQTGEATLAACPYNIREEQALYPPELPAFYKERLALGI